MAVAKTLKELRQRVSQNLADLELLTASGNGSTTTLVCTSRLEPDGHWRGSEILPIGGTAGNLGVAREVTAWDLDTSTFTLSPAWASATAASDTYEMRNLRGRGYTKAEVELAINQAINEVSGIVRAEKYDKTSLTLASTTYEYAIPMGFTHLYAVHVEMVGGYWVPLSPSLWSVRPARLLHISPDTTYNYASSALMLVGYQDIAELAADDDECPVDATYVVAQACAYLLQGRAGSAAQDVDAHGPKADWWEKLAENRRVRIRTVFPPNCRKVLA